MRLRKSCNNDIFVCNRGYEHKYLTCGKSSAKSFNEFFTLIVRLNDHVLNDNILVDGFCPFKIIYMLLLY